MENKMVPKKCLVVWISRLILKLISPCIKSDFKILEKLEKKFILNKLHLEFNEICIKENLLPNYTNILTCIHLYIFNYMHISMHIYMYIHKQKYIFIQFSSASIHL